MKVHPQHPINSSPNQLLRRFTGVRRLLDETAVVPIASSLLLGGCLAIAFTPEVKAQPMLVKQEWEDVARSRRHRQDYDIDGYLVFVNRYSPNLLEIIQRVERNATRVRFKGRDVIQLGVYRSRSTAQNRVNSLERRGIIADLATVDVRRTARQFFVYVVNNDPLLLEEILAIAPEAFPVRYKGRNVIQVGIYNDEYRAVRLVRRLRDRRIIARIDLIEFEESWARFEPVNEVTPVRFNQDRSHYAVVIPCREDEIPYVEAQVRQMVPDLGIKRGVYVRNGQEGPYVLVGPFRDKDTAEKWNRYLHDFGLEDARVHYGR
jgi:hypothetical protein